ncbi:hypothetical protein SLS59_003494 [Nothophoma quercina]|uniref:Uncharacterized protein n=1 Tax=Nothophoma quercina TaxID=749835 RepID=A0ABR3RMM5_9PLEO
MSSNVNVSGRNWKRTASDMDGTGVETEVRAMRRRMTELSMSPPPANGALVRPAVHNQRSDPAMHAYNSFVEQIMAQKTEEWAHKETVLERQIRLLQTQLADEQKRSSETAARAEEET